MPDRDLVGSLLARLGIDGFEMPGLLPWIFFAVLAIGLARFRMPRDAISWSAIDEVRKSGARSLELAPGFGIALRTMALICLSLVLAKPVSRTKLPPEPGFGLDLVLVLDTSGSMRALDASIDGSARPRLDLAKQAVHHFASERVAEGDRLGLVVFGDHAFTQCPLTSDGRLLLSALSRVEVGVAGETTALGDALSLAIRRVSGGAQQRGAGRAIVLLSDGRDNAGATPLSIASELARAATVRVHAVGIGTGGDVIAMAPRTSASAPAARDTETRLERHDPDLEALRRAARATGGHFFSVQHASDLDAVYRSIDSFERIERALPARIATRERPEPLLAAGGGFLLLEILVVRLWRRRLPA